MDIHAPKLTTVEDFIDWVQVQPRGRHELHRGRIVELAAERVVHIAVKTAACSALARAIQRSGVPCHALADGITVKIDRHTSYAPDALIYAGARLPDDTVVIPAPVVIVEVLSPSTAKTDKETKAMDYFTLPSVAHYLVLDPQTRGALHHWRTKSGKIARKMRRAGTLTLEPPGLAVPIAELFAPVL